MKKRIYHIFYSCINENNLTYYASSIYETEEDIETINGYNNLAKQIEKDNDYKNVAIITWHKMKK